MYTFMYTCIDLSTYEYISIFVRRYRTLPRQLYVSREFIDMFMYIRILLCIQVSISLRMYVYQFLYVPPVLSHINGTFYIYSLIRLCIYVYFHVFMYRSIYVCIYLNFDTLLLGSPVVNVIFE